jgi:3',5'-cyclic AMP phosphodiesterase CpdA
MRRLAVLGAALALAGCGAQTAVPPPGSTLLRTLADPDGDGALATGPAEPLRDRTNLGPATKPGAVIATFAQLTDAHVRDEESPARAPFLDRYGRPFDSTFRPQEALTPHVLAAAVRALNAQRPQAVFVTGDLADSAQQNELTQALAVLNGGVVEPGSGAPGYRGVQEPADPDPLYYRPDLDAPRHPGLLGRAQRPFRSPGLKAPWYAAVGNHDVLVSGEVPPSAQLDGIATGTDLTTSLDPSFEPDEGDRRDPVGTLLFNARQGRREAVPADPARAHEPDVVARLGGTGERLDRAVDVGPGLRAVILDTARRDGGSGGIVTAHAAALLEQELATGKPLIVLSHHRLDTAENAERVMGMLDASDHVIALISGHSHRNRITPRAGYWMVSTASLVDFPQQARMFRLRRTGTDRTVLETWMVDHDGRGLAGSSRELAYLDAQGGRPQHFAGGVRDRNVRLYGR